MPEQIDKNANVAKVVEVICAAGGSFIGRTRLQKTFYLLELAGFMDGFDFEYRHYGPYSEQLSQATLYARMLGIIQEDERRATWGGTYSIFRATGQKPDIDPTMQAMIEVSVSANPIALELAATAAFLALEGYPNPWAETVDRKSDKSAHLEEAKVVYSNLEKIATPKHLPVLSA